MQQHLISLFPGNNIHCAPFKLRCSTCAAPPCPFVFYFRRLCFCHHQLTNNNKTIIKFHKQPNHSDFQVPIRKIRRRFRCPRLPHPSAQHLDDILFSDDHFRVLPTAAGHPGRSLHNHCTTPRLQRRSYAYGPAQQARTESASPQTGRLHVGRCGAVVLSVSAALPNPDAAGRFGVRRPLEVVQNGTLL